MMRGHRDLQPLQLGTWRSAEPHQRPAVPESLSLPRLKAVFRTSLTLLVAVGISACEALTPVKSDLADADVEIRAQWTSTRDSQAAQQGWLNDFDDPILDALVLEALVNNYDLRATATRVPQARAQARIVGAELYPRVDVGATAARRGLSSNGDALNLNSYDLEVDVAWEADIWGRLRNDTLAATLNADATAANYAAARLSVAARVAQAWFNLVEAELQVELAEQTVRNFRDNLEIVTEGFRSGLNSALDVRLERANLAGAESELEATRIVRDGRARALDVLLGRYPAAELAIARSLPTINTPVPPGLPAQILERRPDVRAAALQLAASDENYNAARKNRLPRIFLTAGGGATSGDLRDLLDLDDLVWRIVGDISAPVLQGGRLQAERDLAKATSDEALANYAQTVLVAFREVETALTAERLLALQEASLRIAATESNEAERLALERYRVGLVDIITWLEARRRAFNANSSLIAVSNRRIQNRIDLYLALGGGFAPEPL